MSAQSAIHAVLTARTKALHDKDAAATTALYEPRAVMFELAPPLAYSVHPQHTPKGYRAWFATWDGPVGYDNKDFVIDVQGDFAWAHGFVHVHGTKTDGKKESVWCRQTVAFRKSGHGANEGWRIAHQHSSVPFYMDGSERAATDLKP